MAKTKLSVKDPQTGTVYERTTARVYTHVVVGATGPGFYSKLAADYSSYSRSPSMAARKDEFLAQAASYRATAEAKRSQPVSERGALTWCGRPDLAAKAVAKYVADGYVFVEAIPVVQEA